MSVEANGLKARPTWARRVAMKAGLLRGVEPFRPDNLTNMVVVGEPQVPVVRLAD
jgi:hypothetical protein